MFTFIPRVIRTCFCIENHIERSDTGGRGRQDRTGVFCIVSFAMNELWCPHLS